MKICEYGCGQEAKYPFKNGKWCCSNHYMKCPTQQKKNSIQKKKERKDPNSIYNSKLYKENHSNGMKKAHRDPNNKFNSKSYRKNLSDNMKKARKDPNSKYNSIEYKENLSNSMKEAHKDPNNKYNSDLYRERLSNASKEAWNNRDSKLYLLKVTIEKINKKYPFFSKIEEMRYTPDKPEEKEIQVRCKNHNCENSKEKNGWFTPSRSQINYRIKSIENPIGFGEDNFYCSQHCKDTCLLYGMRGDPYRNTNKPYTSSELDVFNKLVLKRDNEICYYCNKHHATIVHHRRPQKLEPFFALDPDYAISVCEKCHYKYGHPTGSEHSTGNLAKIVCSVESQKFLEQNHK